LSFFFLFLAFLFSYFALVRARTLIQASLCMAAKMSRGVCSKKMKSLVLILGKDPAYAILDPGDGVLFGLERKRGVYHLTFPSVWSRRRWRRTQLYKCIDYEILEKQKSVVGLDGEWQALLKRHWGREGFMPYIPCLRLRNSYIRRPAEWRWRVQKGQDVKDLNI
jgi:hypothetical protein